MARRVRGSRGGARGSGRPRARAASPCDHSGRRQAGAPASDAVRAAARGSTDASASSGDTQAQSGSRGTQAGAPWAAARAASHRGGRAARQAGRHRPPDPTQHRRSDLDHPSFERGGDGHQPAGGCHAIRRDRRAGRLGTVHRRTTSRTWTGGSHAGNSFAPHRGVGLADGCCSSHRRVQFAGGCCSSHRRIGLADGSALDGRRSGHTDALTRGRHAPGDDAARPHRGSDRAARHPADHRRPLAITADRRAQRAATGHPWPPARRLRPPGHDHGRRRRRASEPLRLDERRSRQQRRHTGTRSTRSGTDVAPGASGRARGGRRGFDGRRASRLDRAAGSDSRSGFGRLWRASRLDRPACSGGRSEFGR